MHALKYCPAQRLAAAGGCVSGCRKSVAWLWCGNKQSITSFTSRQIHLAHAYMPECAVPRTYKREQTDELLYFRSLLPILRRGAQTAAAFASETTAENAAQRPGKIVQYKLSDIGEGITEVVIKEWLVKENDKVNQFDAICEVQSDKASVTISSRYDGIIRKLYYNADDTAKVGLPLADIELTEDGENDAAAKKDFEDAPGENLAVISAPSSSSVNLDSSPSVTAAGSSEEKSLATPAVRKLAREHNINIADVRQTGKLGRVLKEDIMQHIDRLRQQVEEKLLPAKKLLEMDRQAAVHAPAAKPQPTPVEAQRSSAVVPTPSRTTPNLSTITPSLGQDTTVPLKGIRKAMVKTMTEALKIPHFAYKDEIDVTALVAHRLGVKHRVEKEYGIRLTFMPFFIKAASIALRQYPMLNAHTDSQCENLIHKASHNIGMAVDSPNGLVVPNIKQVQNKSILQLAAEINELQSKAAQNRLTPDDFKDCTFTLSNIGSIGGTYTMPVIMPPTVAIGGLGKIQALPRFVAGGEGELVMRREIMQISWSADHRVIDGATIARFSNLWKMYLEQPSTMLLELV